MKQDLVRILRDIFTSAGYDVADSYKHDIVAERDGSKTFIKFSSNPDIVEIKNFANQVTEGQGLYAVTGSIDSKLTRDAENIGLRVWDRDDMALQIGKAVLADIEGSASELDLFGKPVPKAVSKTDAAAQEAIHAIFGGGNSGTSGAAEPSSFASTISERKYTPYLAPQAPPQAVPEAVQQVPLQAAPQVPMQPEPQIFAPAGEQDVTPEVVQPPGGINLNIRAAPVRVTQEHAISVAKPHIYTYKDSILKLVPFWRYDYSLSTEYRYKSKIVDISGAASGCLNALNGADEHLVIDDVHDSIVIPDVVYEVKHPITSEEEAKKQLIESIVDEHTKDLRFDNTQGEAIISEHKRFKPALEDIKLDIGLVYVPVWEIKGPRGSIEINAYNAEVLQNPVDDDAEFV
ncbi:hypothetical protein V7O66_10280 [Methanolobus sp. ZRKC3]|uniref:hypothetical protein n=1 Tax=Methanolobus sp. ZRKC3 TaxID=3125786 RepID=UPI00324B58D1